MPKRKPQSLGSVSAQTLSNPSRDPKTGKFKRGVVKPEGARQSNNPRLAGSRPAKNFGDDLVE